MARKSSVISVLITGDSRGLSSALDSAGSKLASFGKASALALAAGVAALAAFAKKSVDAAMEAEAAQSRLANILRNTGLATEDQIRALNDQATALERVGVASGSNITVLQAQLATFDLSAETIRTLTPAITDYVIAEKGAAASAGDFQSAANGLAQALQGNFASLTRTGFVLDDATKAMITNGTEAQRAAALVEVLGSTYAGFNEQARETTQGQLQALKNAFGALQEQIGSALLPLFNAFIGVMSRLMTRLQELWEVHGPAIVARLNAFKDRALELWEALKERLEPVVAAVVAKVKEMVGVLVETWKQIKEKLQPKLEELVVKVKELWGQFQEALVRFREWRDEVGPSVIESFKRLKTPLVEIWSSLKDLWYALKDLFAAFKTGESEGGGFLKFVDALTSYFGILLKAVNFVIQALVRLLEVMRRIAESAAFKALQSGISSLASGIGSGIQRLGSVLGLADGGIVTGPTLAMIGEGGESEAVIPLSRLGDFGGPRGNTVITVNVSGALDTEGVARQIERILRDSKRRTGGVFV